MPRTPSTKAHEAVLAATLKVIAERGIDAASMDAIAEVAGVSKATVYKHWENKDALCIEAISRLKSDLPLFDSGNPRFDLTRLLNHVGSSKKKEAFSRIWQRIMTYASSNKSFARAFHARMSEGHRSQMAILLRAAISSGELGPKLDLDSAIDMLLGPIIYRRFMQEMVPSTLVKTVVESFWRANASPRRSAVRTLHRGRV